MSSDSLETRAETQAGGSRLQMPVALGYQLTFAVGATLVCLLLSHTLAISPIPTYHEFYDQLKDGELFPLIAKLASVGRFPHVLLGTTHALIGDLYIQDFAHLCGAVGEGAAVFSCLLVPKRILKCGCLGYAALPPLIFVLLVICAERSALPFLREYGWYATFPSAQTLFLALSCFISVMRCKLTGGALTSLADGAMFWLFTAALFTTVTYFDLTTATFCRM